MEAKVRPETAWKKAELLAGGAVRIPADYRLPFLPSRSTAGPGAGGTAVVFGFGNTRAQKLISREEGDFQLIHENGRLIMMKGSDVFLDEVELVPTLLHAPNQAFVNIDQTCIMGCKFCASPRLEGILTKNLTDEKILKMIKEASQRNGFQSVAFTSAIPVSPAMTVKRMAGLVRAVRGLLPDVPIGVEPYATRPDEIEMLREAGADEIKLNIESFDRDIFERVCPKRDYDHILHAINHSGKVFGRNRVCSNIIYGLGETDENILEGVKVLANMGAVATLRALRKNEYNVTELENALGPLPPVTPNRMLSLAHEQKSILREYGLTSLSFKTMCHSCLACDIVPFWDV
ncbi:MAG: radical SAM protein [Candidatus Thermoplasmatota archaeon]|nr:radical SAM protein [Candidatus Thermoplasmatota archaeon]